MWQQHFHTKISKHKSCAAIHSASKDPGTDHGLASSCLGVYSCFWKCGGALTKLLSAPAPAPRGMMEWTRMSPALSSMA